MHKNSQLLIFLSVLCMALFVSACGKQGKDERGFRYMPDMYDAPWLESQDAFVRTRKVEDANGNITIEKTEIPAMQQPVPGTVSRSHIPYVSSGDGQADQEAAKSLHNPLDATEEVLILGRDKFDIYCAVCHGKDGNVANGYVSSYLTGVLSINTENVEKLTDGQIYQIITHGRTKMPSYGAQLLPDERWAVVHYVRALGTAAKFSKEDKARLQQLQSDNTQFRPKPEPKPEYERGSWPEKLEETAE